MLDSLPIKLMERVLRDRLLYSAESPELDNMHPPNSEQFGFRRHRSSQHCYMTKLDLINRAREVKWQCLVIYLDLEKAFELVNHTVLLHAVASKGVNGKLLSYLKAYLQDRSARVAFQGCNSSYHPTDGGVPQGAILSPTIFNMVVDEIHSLALDHVEVLSYADDLAVVISHPTRALELAQRAMDMVSSKCKELGLKISGSKTTAMSYLNCLPPRAIILDGVPLKWSQTYKYLGIIFDRRLTFAAQVKSLNIRMSARLNVMRSISKITWGANKTNLSFFYQQAIVSLVDSSAPALYSLSPHSLSSKKDKRDFNKLFKGLDNLQLSACRTLIGAPRIAKVTLIIKETSLPSIRERVSYIGRSFLASMASKVDSNLGRALRDHFKELHLPPHEATETLSIKFKSLTQEAYQAGSRLFEPVIKEPCNPLEVNPFLVKVARGFKKEEVPAISLRTLAEEEISWLSEAFPHALHIFTDGSVMPDSGRAGSAALHPHSNPPEVLRERVTDGASTLSTELHAIDMSLKQWP